MTSHFFKTLLLFTIMIVLGLLGIFLLGRLDQKDDKKEVQSGIEEEAP